MRGEVTAGGTSAMAAAHAQQRAQTVQRSHPASRQDLLPNTQRKELGRFSFLSVHPGERAVSDSPSLSFIPPLLPSLSGCQEPRGSRKGEEMPWREELPTAPEEVDWSDTGYKRRHRAEQFLPSLRLSPATADDNKLTEKGVRMRGDERWLLCRSEASGCSDGETAGENPVGLGERHPLPTSAPEMVLGRQCIQGGDNREVPTMGNTALCLFP